MTATNRRDAVGRLRDPIQLAMSCVTDGVVHFQPSRVRLVDASRETLMVALNRGDPVRLSAAAPMFLKVQCLVDVEHLPAAHTATWQARITGYFYELLASFDEEIAAYHLHPPGTSGYARPHVHIGVGATGGVTRARPGTFHKIHFPTEHVAIEDSIRLAIVEFGARPRRPDWEAILDDTRRLRADD